MRKRFIKKLTVTAILSAIVVLLNNDVAPEPGFLAPLVENFDDLEVFAVGCKEKDVKNEKILFSGRAEGEFRRGFLVHWRAKDQPTSAAHSCRTGNRLDCNPGQWAWRSDCRARRSAGGAREGRKQKAQSPKP